MLISVALAKAVGVGGRPGACPRAAEVVEDEVGPGDAERVKAAAQVGGVAVHGVVEAGRLVGLAEPRVVPGDGAGERCRSRSSSRTQSWLEPGLPWTKTTASVACGRPGLQQRGADAVDGQGGLCEGRASSGRLLLLGARRRPRAVGPRGGLPRLPRRTRRARPGRSRRSGRVDQVDHPQEGAGPGPGRSRRRGGAGPGRR